MALATHLGAEIMVGTFSYNKGAYGALSVKRGRSGPKEKDLWYDPAIEPHVVDDRVELAPGLQWCGEMNILPTAVDPLSGFQTYTGRASGIFPHAKIAMRSVAAGVRGEATKFNYTTGTVTKRNYVQKRAGLRAEHHHSYGGLIVEVTADGWWVRQLHCADDGTLYDLNLVVEDGEVYENDTVAAITWGDVHHLLLDPTQEAVMLNMLDSLKPEYQFVHDLMLGAVTNHHERNNVHERFRRHVRGHGWSDLSMELLCCAAFLRRLQRKDCQILVVDSNHDRSWIERWLREADGRQDPKNAMLWLHLNLAWYEDVVKEPTNRERFHVLEHALHLCGGITASEARFLRESESFTITPARVECGMHGHLGADGRRGHPAQLRLLGRRANVGHFHSAGIWDGLYAAGVSCQLDMGYNRGPSSWSQSHIITYPNGKRTIVTTWQGRWRA